MHVTIYQLDQQARDEVVGTLELVKGKLIAKPPADFTLQGILQETYYAPYLQREVSAKQPKEFLEHLHTHYKSAYLRASKLQDGTGE